MSTAKVPASVTKVNSTTMLFSSAIAGDADNVNAQNTLTQLASGIWLHNGLKVHDANGGFSDREMISGGSVLEPCMEISNADHALSPPNWNWVGWTHGNEDSLGWSLKADGMDITYLAANDAAGAAVIDLHQHSRLYFPGTTTTIGWRRAIHRFDAAQLTVFTRTLFKPGFFLRTHYPAAMQQGADVDRWLVEGGPAYVLLHNGSQHNGPQAQRFSWASAAHSYRVVTDMLSPPDYSCDGSNVGCTVEDHNGAPAKGYADTVSNVTNTNWPAAAALNTVANVQVFKT